MIFTAGQRVDVGSSRFRRPLRVTLFAIGALLIATTGCALVASREGIPSAAQAAIDVVSRDILEGNFEKVYNEASEEWRGATTPDQSRTILKTLKDKLGNVKSRSFHSATEQRNTGGQLPGHSFIIVYRTTFERGEGMETFTLIERDGQWKLARYFVNSDALK